MKKKFSDVLKELRIQAGYSQKDVYDMLGIRQSTFSAWETGRAEPSADMLLKLCKLYNIKDIFSAFGYDGYSEDGNPILNIREVDMIEKYRDLDTHGKEMVDFTLLKEWERSTAEQKGSGRIAPMTVREDASYINAAHARDGATEEDRQFDEGIMDDENF